MWIRKIDFGFGSTKMNDFRFGSGFGFRQNFKFDLRKTSFLKKIETFKSKPKKTRYLPTYWTVATAQLLRGDSAT